MSGCPGKYQLTEVPVFGDQHPPLTSGQHQNVPIRRPTRCLGDRQDIIPCIPQRGHNPVITAFVRYKPHATGAVVRITR